MKCAKPRISAYSFVKCLCAALTSQGKVIVDLPSVVKNVYDSKRSTVSALDYVFYDIEFRAGFDSISSNDISEGFNNLQTFGIVGKLNPTYSKMVIYLTQEEAKDILEERTRAEADFFNDLAKKFH